MDNFTGDETLEQLDEMLSEYDDVEIIDDDDDTEEQDDAQAESTKQPDEEHSDTQANSQAAAAPEQEQTVILAKDGRNAIPYQVLEAERSEKAQAVQRAAELEALLAQKSHSEQLLKMQLTRAGLEPQDSAEALKLSPEALQQMREEMPHVAAEMEKLAARNEQNEALIAQMQKHLAQQQQNAQNERRDEAYIALQENELLRTWNESPDRTRFDTACLIDKTLESDPVWAAKPMRERFAEVTRRTCIAFGDEVPGAPDRQQLISAAQEKAKKTLNETRLPDSPSQIGGQPAAPKNITDRLAGASSDELYSLMSSMTSEQIEEQLAELGI